MGRVVEADKIAPLFRLLLMNNKCADAIIHDVQKIVDLQSIDPIHAAGGCYCRECKNEVSTDKMREVSGALWCKYKLQPCNPNDFCSYGKARTE